MAFSVILKDLREETGLSQKELAIACKLSPQCISALEQGTRNPTGSTVATLATFFGVSADYLLELENDYGAKIVSPAGDVLKSDERELLNIYRSLSDYLQGLTLNTVRSWAGKPSEGNSSLQKKA